MYNISILKPSDSHWKAKSVFMLPEYYDRWEIGESCAKCFVYGDDTGQILYPHLVNKDAKGCYGYNGVEITGEPDIKNFSSLFRRYCQDIHIHEEFTRFNPVLQNQGIPDHLSLEHVNDNVIIDLSKENAYNKACRKNINKAKREGVSITFDRYQDVFNDIYTQTMNRNNAAEGYYFGDNFFQAMNDKLSNNTLFVYARYQDKVVSCELILYDEGAAYSFLGGTLSDFFHVRSNNLLKHEIIKKLQSMGIKHFCLGGGKTLNDGIFKYKWSFGGEVVPFFVGRYQHA